jgi:hypothetical protein
MPLLFNIKCCHLKYFTSLFGRREERGRSVKEGERDEEID